MRIAARFAGAVSTAHSGVLAGRLAAYIGATAVEVTMHRPARLDVDLRIDISSGTARLYDGTLPLAEAGPATLDLESVGLIGPGPESPPLADRAFAASHAHPHSVCFGCGADRVDGLGLRPGRRADGRVAADWTPVTENPVQVWAALHCLAAWATSAASPVALDRMALTAPGRIIPDEPHVVVGWIGRTPGTDPGAGSGVSTSSALLSSDGSVLAVAHSTWSLGT